ncbi:hypothetical protein [Paraburkholderia ginsengisoli]|uniref:Uncharacterized protein n=1 Tax=Paraburkholderia ginsengisoli TaxID=311231 RepID=A0A7T4N1X4_9BURK|nr:hypothetical protein [Paraburkholderia ginsengisoli]QQC63746.1 hypothetical protein I6I06_15825 [Paraburkholderia ginsengisoli]
MNELRGFLAAGDSDASAPVARIYFGALKDRATVLAMERVKVAERALVDAGGHYELWAAAHQSLADGRTVAQVLRERELHLMRQRELANIERAAFVAAADARRAEVEPILAACASELLALSQKITALDLQVRRVATLRAASLEAMEAAGLTLAQIESIGAPRPTASELAEWQSDLAAMRARADRLKAFRASAPFFDLALLDDSTDGTANGRQ